MTQFANGSSHWLIQKDRIRQSYQSCQQKSASSRLALPKGMLKTSDHRQIFIPEEKKCFTTQSSANKIHFKKKWGSGAVDGIKVDERIPQLL